MFFPFSFCYEGSIVSIKMKDLEKSEAFGVEEAVGHDVPIENTRPAYEQ